ncbi:MAG: hypothetical protein KZQ93_15800 [Candidatus Thiodiazotropha sp. (ex Monitilora ramsayi)]|nr:hypothetical protein [Candidatus Thiodiazotropha sp. (ex Monitilora ramsayi)]
MDRVEKRVTIGDKEVTVIEMTVAEVRVWFKGFEGAAKVDDADLLGNYLFEDFTLKDMARMTDMDESQLELFTPSQLQHLREVCEEVNPHFFAMRARLLKTLDQVLGPLLKS